MPTHSTKHGEKLHCLKLSDTRGHKKDTVGFIEFEVKTVVDGMVGNVREIYIRSLVVCPHLRRQGYGTRLYHAMLEYLGVGELDAINLYVMDMNQDAINLYFKLGFQVTQWFARRLGDESGFKVVFLCMQMLRRVSDHIPMSLQEMPHLFEDEAVGEVVQILSEDGSCEKRRARVEAYDNRSKMFIVAHVSAVGQHQSQQCRVEKICLNDLYSRGYLTFERLPLRCLPRCSSVISNSSNPVTSQRSIRKRRAWPQSPRKRRVWPKAALKENCGNDVSVLRRKARTRVP
jgi:hypothetical protein